MLPRMSLLKLLGPHENIILYAVRMYEAISQLFSFELEIDSLGTTQESKAWLNRTLSFSVKERIFHGEVIEFVELGLNLYQLKLAPALTKINKIAESRIYCSRTAPDIVRELCGSFSIDFSQLKKNYRVRPFCIQYQESNFAFVERLLAEEGINYLFRFELDRHCLVLIDQPATQAYTEKLYHASEKEDGYLWSWIEYFKHSANLISTIDDNPNYSAQALQLNYYLNTQNSIGIFEKKFYPGAYDFYTEAQDLLKYRVQAYEVNRRFIEATSAYNDLNPYQLVQLYADPDSHYLVSEIWHTVEDLSYRNSFEPKPPFYANKFKVHKTFYFRSVIKERPKIKQPQVAIVVGGENQTPVFDEHAQVFLKFPWDSAQCALPARVAQAWVATEAGMQFFPRVGDKVLVYFVNDNPMRPIVWGSLSDSNAPLYPEGRSGIRSANSTTFNELCFAEEADPAHLMWHAARDFVLTAEDAVSEAQNVSLEVAQDAKFNVRENMELVAAELIEFKVGETSLTLSPDKIILAAPIIKLN